MTNARTARTTREKAAALRAEAARAQARRRNILISAIVAVVVVAVAATVVIVRQAQHSAAVAAASAPSGVPRNLLADGGIGGVSAGSGGASPAGKDPVTVEMWEDFQCPICRDFEAANRDQLERWAKQGVVRLVYKPVAILDRSSTTKYSSRALNTAAAVVDSDPAAFPAFHDLLYANQPAEGSAGLSDEQLLGYAVQAGAPRAAVASAQGTDRFGGWVLQRTDAFSQKYTGTPTVLVDGSVVQGVPDAATLRGLVTKAAAAKGLPTPS